MKIINGRKLGDANGRFKCYSRNSLMPSVIDYTIVDNNLFHEIRFFRVDSLTTFSDHCPISFSLKTNFMVDTSIDTNHMKLLTLPDKFVWNDNSPGAFKCSLNSDEIRKALNDICNTQYGISYQKTDIAVTHLNNAIYRACKMATINCKTPPPPPPKKQNKTEK